MANREFKARLAAPAVSGEVTLAVLPEGIQYTAPLAQGMFSYAEILGFEMRDYSLYLRLEAGEIAISRLGNQGDAFVHELAEAYNAKVCKALFVKGAPLLVTKGDFRYIENGVPTAGKAAIRVYENCVCILPPDDRARRVPLCFVTGLDKGDFTLTLTLDDGAQYSFMRLGYDSDPFEKAILDCLQKLRAQAMENVRELDGSLSDAQTAAIAALMPQGAAVPLGRLDAIAPGFSAALEARLRESRAGESQAVFETLCRRENICVGFKKAFSSTVEKTEGAPEDTAIPAGLEKMLPEGLDKMLPGAAAQSGKQLLWMLAPGANGHSAAVEFAVEEGESAATFLYRFSGEWAPFACALNHAMEAIDFKREVIRLTAQEMDLPEHSDYKMAQQRVAALRFVRESFHGRAIHASAASWQQEIQTFFT